MAEIEVETIPDSASCIRLHDGTVWWRLYGGQFDGLWTTDDGPTVPTSGRGMRQTRWLAASGPFTVLEED